MTIINENKLLVYCSQKNNSERITSRIKHLISDQLRWELVMDSALSENIAPLLYHNLKAYRNSNIIPPQVIDIIEKAYYGNTARNMRLFSELRRILVAFNENNIDIMILKGAALANTVYGDIGLRSMLDIDLLVKQDDLSRAKGIMSDLDYLVSSEVPSEEWHRKHHFHLPAFIHKKKFIGVEIHWDVANKSFEIDINKWWHRPVTAEIEKCPALIPSPEDMLIHLCLQLYYQSYRARSIKRGIGDVYETLTYYKKDIDWKFFQNEINLCRMVKPVYSILYLIEKIFGNGDNSIVKIKLEHIDMKFITILEDRIFMSSTFPGPFIKYYAADGFHDKARAIVDGVFPERERMAKYCSLPMNSKKLYLHYMIRPFVLLFKYWKILFKVFRIKNFS